MGRKGKILSPSPSSLFRGTLVMTVLEVSVCFLSQKIDLDLTHIEFLVQSGSFASQDEDFQSVVCVFGEEREVF